MRQRRKPGSNQEWLLSFARNIGPPPVAGDVRGPAHALALAQKALGTRAVGKEQCADTERRWDAGNKAAERLDRERPHLGGNGVAPPWGNAHQPWPACEASRQRIELV